MCTVALPLPAFFLTTDEVSCTKIKWDHKTTDTFQSRVVTSELKMANVIGKNTTYLTAIDVEATEFGRSKFEKKFMEISVCL